MLIETTHVETPSSSLVSKINIPTYCHVKNAMHGPAPAKKKILDRPAVDWPGSEPGPGPVQTLIGTLLTARLPLH